MKQDLKVFIDLDGVLVDWLGAAMDLTGLDKDNKDIRYAIATEYDAIDRLIGWPKLAEAINKAGVDHWLNMAFLPWAVDLIEVAKKAVGESNVAFLTSPGKFTHAPTGKFMWREKYYPNMNMIITRSKYILAGPNSYLIDDDIRQFKSFLQHGGYGWLWKNQYVIEEGGTNATNRELEYLAKNIEKAKAGVPFERK